MLMSNIQKPLNYDDPAKQSFLVSGGLNEQSELITASISKGPIKFGCSLFASVLGGTFLVDNHTFRPGGSVEPICLMFVWLTQRCLGDDPQVMTVRMLLDWKQG